MCMSTLSPCMYTCHMHVWYSWSLEEGIGSLRNGITDGHEPLCGCWELWVVTPSPTLPRQTGLCCRGKHKAEQSPAIQALSTSVFCASGPV